MVSPTHAACEGDLSDRARKQLELAYKHRSRSKASREDFADGYVAALLDHELWSMFSTPPWQLRAHRDAEGGRA
jgi:hypothetical protein